MSRPSDRPSSVSEIKSAIRRAMAGTLSRCRWLTGRGAYRSERP
jgi:hypothetical protein